MQRDGRMMHDVDDDAFTKPFCNWNTRVRLRPGTRTRLLRTTPCERLDVAEIAARIKYGRY